jgi:hypothetical protein
MTAYVNIRAVTRAKLEAADVVLKDAAVKYGEARALFMEDLCAEELRALGLAAVAFEAAQEEYDEARRPASTRKKKVA